MSRTRILPAAGTTPALSAVIPLENLLTWRPPRPVPELELDLRSDPKVKAEQDASNDSGPDRPIYVTRESEDLSPHRKRETTDVGVRVPVDDSVTLRGGGHIESQDDGTKRSEERTPTVGVDVRF